MKTKFFKFSGRIKNEKFNYILPVLCINLVILLFVFFTPPYIINSASDTNGYLGLANNIIKGYFFNSMPHNTYSLGAPLFFAIAFIFKSNTLRFLLIYLIQLFFINVALYFFARSFKIKKGILPNKYILAIILLSAGFLGMFFYIMTETIFTVFLVVIFSLFIELFYSKSLKVKNNFWTNFLLPIFLGASTSFLGSIRETGYVFSVFVILGVFYLLIVRRVSIKAFILFLLGLFIGYVPELFQEINVKNNPLSYSWPYASSSGTVSYYFSHLKVILSSKEFFITKFFAPIIHQYILFLLFSLGVPLTLFPRLLSDAFSSLNLFSKDSNHLSWSLIISFLFPILLHLGQSIFHVWGYLLSDTVKNTHMARYIIPISTLSVVMGFTLGTKKKTSQFFLYVMYAFLFFSLFYPIDYIRQTVISNRGVQLSSVATLLPSGQQFLYTLILIVIILLMRSLFTRKKFLELFLFVLFTFGFSYAINQSFFIDVSASTNPRTKLITDVVQDEDIRTVYLLHPSDIRYNQRMAKYKYYEDYSQVFLTENVYYRGYVKELFESLGKIETPSIIVIGEEQSLKVPSSCHLLDKKLQLSGTYLLYKCVEEPK